MTKKSWDSDWVHFSKRARRGIIVLLILFIAVAVAPRLYHNYIYTPPNYDVQIRPIIAAKAKSDSIEEVNKEASKFSQPPTMFNPNTYTQEDWMNIGLSEKQSASIIKYLSFGTDLKVKSDLKKLYVVNDELYKLLEPKIDLPDSLTKRADDNTYSKSEKTYDSNKNEFPEPEIKEVKPVSINTASDWDLKKIPGIGPFYAKEIIRIREELGGIISYDQLFEIYKMDEEKLEALKPYLIIDLSEVKKININNASEKKLRKHPLINYDMAKSIVFFRENHRSYKRIDEIILSPYIDGDKFKELKPYLRVE